MIRVDVCNVLLNKDRNLVFAARFAALKRYASIFQVGRYRCIGGFTIVVLDGMLLVMGIYLEHIPKNDEGAEFYLKHHLELRNIIVDEIKTVMQLVPASCLSRHSIYHLFSLVKSLQVTTW